MNKPKWAQKTIDGKKGVKAIPEGNHYIAVYSQRVKDEAGKRTTVKTSLGIIVPGAILTPDTTVAVKPLEIYEYGFSKAVFDLCPLGWKNHVDRLSAFGWLNVLLSIIATESPRSYLVAKYPVKSENRYFGIFRKELENALPLSFKELRNLFGEITYVSIGGQVTLSSMNAETKQAANQYGIRLEEVI